MQACMRCNVKTFRTMMGRQAWRMEASRENGGSYVVRIDAGREDKGRH